MKKIISLLILTLLPMLASAQTALDVQNSGCLSKTRGEETQWEPTIILTKEGSTLSVQLLNYESNCATQDFNVSSSINGEGGIYGVSVDINPVLPELVTSCLCPFNISFTIHDMEPNCFYLNCWWYSGNVELTEGEPLVLDNNNPDTQEYFPEGTKWTEIRLDTLKYDSWYSKVGDEWVPNFETIEYYVKGEYTDNNGKKYKCVYTNGPEWTDSLTLLLQEEGDAEYVGYNTVMVSVLAHDDDGSSRTLWPGEAYQFDWTIGKGLYFKDILLSNTTSFSQSYCYYGIIDEIKEGNFGGVRPLKYVDLDGKAPDNDPNSPIRNASTNGGRILQGIGITEWNDGECLFGPPNPYGALRMFDSYPEEKYPQCHYRSMLVHFERNGEVLYNVWPDKSQQNDYIPFVDMDKQWNVVSTVANPSSSCHFEKYVISEAVERDGKTYFRVWQSEDDLTVVHDAGLYREENRRVYKYDETAGRDIMLYDFSLKEGDTFTYEMGIDNPVNCKVLKQGLLDDGPFVVSSYNSTDTLSRYRHLRTWTIGGENGLGEYDEIATWVECVGALENMFNPFATGKRTRLAYIDYSLDKGGENAYLPFSFCNIYDAHGQVHGNDMPTGAADNVEIDDWHHHLTYELEGDRLHVYGKVFCSCGVNHYAYFYEEPTDDPMVRKIRFEIQNANTAYALACQAHHPTNFYVPGFDPNLNYIVVDNQGKEHPVINKTPQNDYRPFIEEGKVWKVGGDGPRDPVQLVEYYYFDGDTIIGGKTCKQMMRQRYVNPDHPDYAIISQYPMQSYVGAWYEEDKKVYLCNTTDQQFKLMYDFSVNADDTLQINNLSYAIGPKQTGGLKGFKGVYRDVRLYGMYNTTWLEGVGNIDGPIYSVYLGKEGHALFLMSCTVGDEVIYLNDEYEDGATPAGARKRFDFTHTIKTKPKSRMRSGENQSLHGEYNDLQLGINLNPLDDAYLVRITDDAGKVIYEKSINASNIVGLNIDISAYAKGHYAVIVENSDETFTGEFDAQTTGIRDVRWKKEDGRSIIYNLQGQRLHSLQKGLNIVNGQKVFVK